MPASITLSNISWSTPEGRPLFSGLDLHFDAERTGLIGRNGVGKTTLFRLIAGETAPQSGRTAVNGTLGWLRQTVQIAPEETVASLFGVSDALAMLRRAEAGEATENDLANTDWTLEDRIAAALARAGLEADPGTRLTSLSGGQRTRAALAALILSAPDILLLDEPTNNLDADGRRAVIDFLAGWHAGAVVISHDRDLLDTMDAIVELTTLGATRYGGNWTHFRERKALELSAAQRDLSDAEKRVEDVARSARKTAERKARKDGAGQRKRERNDIPRILLDKMKDRSEGTTGANARLADRRRAEASQAANAARQRIEILTPFSVTLASTGLPAGRTVLKLDGLTAGYTQDKPVLRDFSLHLAGPERVAVTGPNGSGKTTLLAAISGRLKPFSGSVQVPVAFAMLDQRVSLLDPEASIRDNFRRLNPQSDENACRAALARFMFRADAALQTVSCLSGGQLLRAGLACALGGGSPPPLLILDEPTNHLDIVSIETVEAGLSAYDGALLVVSHDETFLDAIGISRRIALHPAYGRP